MKRNNESNKQVDTSNADPNVSSSTRVTSLSNAPVATTTSNGYTGFFTFTQPRRRGGKRKIPIEYIKDKTRRQITFSKRKAGIMKKAYELGHLTGSEVMVLVVSETNQVYTFATEKFQQYFTHPEAKLLLHQCIHSPESLNSTNPEPNLILPSASASNSSSSAPESSASSSVVQSPAPAALNEELDLDAEEEEPDEQDEE